MGRREQKERERKRAAASCQTLDSFLPAAKPSRPGSTSAEDDRDNLPPAERTDDDSTITEGSRPGSTSAEDNRDNLPPAERTDDDSTITEGSRPSSTSAEDDRDNLPPAERTDDDSMITEGTSNVVTVTERQGSIEVAYRDSEDINSSVNDSDVNNSADIDSPTVTVAEPQGYSVSSFSNETMHFDIGGIVACCPTEDDVIDELHALSTAQKYRLLTQHDKPDKKYVVVASFKTKLYS